MKTGRNQKNSSQNQVRAGFAFVWNIVFLVLGMLVMLIIQSRLGIFKNAQPKQIAPATPATATAALPANPWGTLECIPFSLEQPENFLPDSSRRLATPKWFFEGYTQAQLLEFLNSTALTSAQKAALLNPSQWEINAQGIYVSPARELIRSLSGASRQQIYSLLAQSDVNLAHRYPFRCRLDGFEQWFGSSNLSMDKLDLIRSLTITNGQSLALVDMDILQDALTPEEFKAVFRSLYSEPSVLALLKVPPGEDVSSLVKYWGRNGRENVVAPVLKSMAKDGGTLSVSHLLPAFARLRLYTYTPPTEDSNGAPEDGFWAAMNFFNEKPDPSLLNSQAARQRLKSDYLPIAGQKALGDLLVLMDKNDRPLHVAVHIADDVVFTKNGTSSLEPFVLMKMRDVLAKYQIEGGLRVATLRSKKLLGN